VNSQTTFPLIAGSSSQSFGYQLWIGACLLLGESLAKRAMKSQPKNYLHLSKKLVLKSSLNQRRDHIIIFGIHSLLEMVISVPMIEPLKRKPCHAQHIAQTTYSSADLKLLVFPESSMSSSESIILVTLREELAV
jgi:hypothetical protein